MSKKYLYLLLIIILACISSGCGKNSKPDISPTPTLTASATPPPTLSPVTNDNNDINDNNSDPSEPESKKDESLDNHLCKENEQVLFSFLVLNSDKTASICISKSQPDYIVYRFGTKDNVELEYPKVKDAKSWSKFIYSYYMRVGGADNEGVDLNYITFDNGGFEYRIYSEYSANEDKTRVGIVVTDLDTGTVTDIEGRSDSILGSLITLRDNPKIKTEMQ